MLLGRERERQRLRAALDRARAGTSDVLGLVGEPGIGKTALLRDAAEQAEGMRVLRARGIESQARIAFASLFELLRPALGALGRIPAPQARALEGALALRVSEAHERFAVGAATLSLLAAHAESGPVLVLVDDAHWLDGSSAEALLFAIRRLIADPIAVLLGVRRDEPSLLDGTDVETLVLSGLGAADAAALLPGLAPDAVRRLHLATGGNPLALLELADEPEALALAPEGAPLLVSARIREAFARRARSLSVAERRVLLLAAASDTGDLALLARAAGRLGLDPAGLVAAEQAGVVSLAAGTVEFRHPLARSAVYASARAQARRDVHRALADALPDTDVDRRAWHLANAVAGPDDGAAAALEMAGVRARGRSAYAPAAVAFERAARLASRPAARGRLLRLAAEASWHAGLVERALALLERAQSTSGDGDGDGRLDLEELAGRIAVRRGPVMRGHDILAAVAERVDPERAAGLRAEAAAACFYAGQPAAMLKIAERAWHELPEGASRRTRFLASAAVGMAWVVGGDAAAGERAVERAIALAEGSGELRHDIDLLPWLAVAPIILRDATAGRRLLADALKGARARSAIGTLPFVLTLVALDHATTDRWDLAAATYREAIGLAREGDQRTVLAFGLSGLVRLLARRGDEAECRALAAEALELCARVGTRLHELWVLEGLAMLELGLGAAARAHRQLERQRRLATECGLTDPDISPLPELVDSLLRLGRRDAAERLAAEFAEVAAARSGAWSLARAERAGALVAAGMPLAEARFEQALVHHRHTPDVFETARTRLAYGERLRRAGRRARARGQLRPALEAFERLGAAPWADRARAELRATGETVRRGDPSARDELTPQELQIGMLLADGRTTREAAAALFLSPKTVEYHLHHVYLKLGIHSREELRLALSAAG
ncbi:MAG TPA: AAA family ATPase [Solirubrobacteraceae bacterium]|nr:AAA family ATPase [Solirubrobacteraceae bacterium]